MIKYYATVAIVTLLGSISPGPDFVVITKYALAHNRYNAIMASLGVVAGVAVHASYCVLGIAAIITHSLFLFNLIKYLGALYLIYLGIKSLLAKKCYILQSNSNELKTSSYMALREGFLTNVLNPKCTLFMLSIFTVVIEPQTVILSKIIYAVEIILIVTIWFIFLSYSLTTSIVKIKIEKLQNLLMPIVGLVFIILGLSIIFK